MSSFLFLILSLLVSGTLIFLRPTPTSWQIGLPRSKASEHSAIPSFITTNLPASEASHHSSNILALNDGTRLLVWFAGSREGAGDVKLLLATQSGGVWNSPQAIQTVASNVKDFGHYTKKIGNPVLFSADNKIHLLFVTVALGGWGGSRLAHSVSSDQGRTWSAPALWITSPFINISTQVRHPPLPVKLDDGSAGWLMPVHHEFMQKFPEYLLLDSRGDFLHKQRMSFGNDLIQPMLVEQSDDQNSLQVFFRPSKNQRQILFADYKNGWDASLQSTHLPNPNSGIALVKIGDKLLLAFNPVNKNRAKLALAMKPKNAGWRVVAEIENGGEQGEFSYPSFAVRGDEIDLTYSYQRQFIKHARFNSAWLEQQYLAAQ